MFAAAEIRFAAGAGPGAPARGTAEDARFMRAALALGRRGLGRTAPNPSVGALVVQTGPDANGKPRRRIVGRGWSQPGGRPHAETMALAEAGEAARGATLYVTLEPCAHVGRTPPCADAIVAAGIRRVVSALEDPNPSVAGRGHARLRESGIDVVTGVLGREARRAHAGHVARMLHRKPHVMLKLAVSADEKIGLAGRRPVPITGPEARARAHLLRAEVDAILIGIGTLRADDPLLTCRLPGLEARSPIRVVIDGRLEIPVEARVVATAHEVPTWIMAAEDAPPERAAALAARGVRVFRVPSRGGVAMEAALRHVAREGVTRVLAEGGARLARSLIDADLVDELILFRAPLRLGPEALGALDGRPLDAALARFRLISSRPVGADRMERYWRARCSPASSPTSAM